MDKRILHEFGLTNNETEIFLSLVRAGPLGATNIAKKTGLNRPYVYYALERLLEKGYISEITVRGKKNFQSVEFDQIIALEEHKIDLLKNLKSEIDSLKIENNDEVFVEVLKGKYAIKNIFKRFIFDIKPKEEVLYIGIDEDKMESLEPIFLRKLLNYLKENEIKERIILRAGGRTLSYAKTTKYKFINSDLIGNTAKIIYQDTVIDLIYGEPIYATISKNEELAETARKQFEVFWKMAKV